jgi:type IV pilus secretin PilQ/predicted competence protein
MSLIAKSGLVLAFVTAAVLCAPLGWKLSPQRTGSLPIVVSSLGSGDESLVLDDELKGMLRLLQPTGTPEEKAAEVVVVSKNLEPPVGEGLHGPPAGAPQGCSPRASPEDFRACHSDRSQESRYSLQPHNSSLATLPQNVTPFSLRLLSKVSRCSPPLRDVVFSREYADIRVRPFHPERAVKPQNLQRQETLRYLVIRESAETPTTLTDPVPVDLALSRSDAEGDLLALASDGVQWPPFSAHRVAQTSCCSNSAALGPEYTVEPPKSPGTTQVRPAVVPSIPRDPPSSKASRFVAAAAAPMDTPQTSIITPPGSHQLAPRYTGRLISLDLRSVDIRDFFRLIHRVSGLNIVVDSDVTGTVTLVLDDVPWDQALDLVLKNNGLGKVLEGNVLRIARVQTLEAEADEAQQLRDARLKSEALVTLVRRLHYASAEDQQPTMTSGSMGGMGGGGGMGGNMGGQQKPIPGVVTILQGTKGILSPRGTVASDSRDNAVIVTDVPSQMPVIEAFIDKLDTKSKQLSIQVRVVLASSDFTRSLSSILSGSGHNSSGSTQTAYGTGTGIVGVPGAVGVTAAGGSGTTTTSLTPPLTAPGFGAFAITNAGARYLINAALSAAESRDQARTISRPTIVTQDNFPGMVMQGVQIPVQTSINLTVAVQYVNAALELMVTPRVTGNGQIYLDINVNNASPGTISVAGVGISINVQQATTRVLVPDGGTVVFGGITVTTRSRSATYVPLLGSIPVLGNLFKSSQTNDQNTELLFFVSPTVLPE